MSDDGKKAERSADVLHFPQSRVAPPQTQGGYLELGTTPLARQLGLEEDQLNGHWCGCCRGIWYGHTLETQCPRCGNRHG